MTSVWGWGWGGIIFFNISNFSVFLSSASQSFLLPLTLTPLYNAFPHLCLNRYFEGPTPVLVSSDPAFLQQVFIKQFSNFHSRKMWPVQVDPDKSDDVHLFFARGQRWKRLRSDASPPTSSERCVLTITQMQILCAGLIAQVIQ